MTLFFISLIVLAVFLLVVSQFDAKPAESRVPVKVEKRIKKKR